MTNNVVRGDESAMWLGLMTNNVVRGDESAMW